MDYRRSTVGARRAVLAAGLLTSLALGPLVGGTASNAHAAITHDAPAAAPRGSSALATTTVTSTNGTASPPTATITATLPASPTVAASPTAVATDTPTATATARARPSHKPVHRSRPFKMPKPTVHRTNGYEIGAYYFSGWSHGQTDNLTWVLSSSPLRKYEPLIGWYDDSQAQVDRNILQASAAGIDFFAFDWYDTARSRYASDKSLNEALGYYLTSQQRYRMNFCLTFIDQAPFLPHARDWAGLVNTWIRYFKQPDYVRVNGKPLFIVFSPEHLREMFGSSQNVHRALDFLRASARKAHLPGVTIAVAATLAPRYNPARISQFRTEGYDVATGYNYHAMGGEKYRRPVPYSHLMQENRQMWDRVASLLPLPYMPVITSGWDQRFSAREQKTAIIYAGRTPAQFACYAAAARYWIDRNVRRTVKERVVLIFAWNETGEGGSIIPDKADRYAYTDALHRVFTAHRAPVCR